MIVPNIHEAAKTSNEFQDLVPSSGTCSNAKMRSNVNDSAFEDANTRKLIRGFRDRLHDVIATFLCDHPEVPPAVVGLTVGRVFLNHYQLSYPEDFVSAARDTFNLIIESPESPLN
jgi:hypothetical protein